MRPAVANGAALLLAPLAKLVLRPWFDRVSLESIAGWYLPLSRAWRRRARSGGESRGAALACRPL